MGSGCGSVGRAVASNTRGLWFESSHRPKFIRTKWGGGIVGGSVRFVRNAFFTLTNACKGGSPGLVVMGGD